MAKEQIELVLVLLNGEEIKLVVPDDIWEDDIWPEIKDNFASQGLWNCGNWGQIKVDFMNENLGYIDFHKVLGIRW